MGTQINRSIVIDAKVKATLEGMNEVVSKLNQGLREGATKVDLTKGVGSSLSKNLDKFKDEYSRFSKFIEGGKIQFADAKDAVKSGETLIRTYREMKRIVGDFNDLTVLDAKKLFPDAFDSRVSDLLGGLDKLSSAMTKLDSKQLNLSTAKTEMKELRDRAQELEATMQEAITLKIEADKTQADLDAIEQEIDAIRKKASEGITLKINTANKEAGDAKAKKDEILAARTARGFNEDDFAGSRTGSTKFKGKTMAQWTAEGSKKGATEATKAEVAAAQEAIRLYEREKNALADLSAIIADREKQAKQLSDTLAKLGTMKLPEAIAAAGGTPEEITEATTALDLQKDAIEANAAAQGKYKVAATQAGRAKKDFDGVTAAIDAQQAKIDKLTLEIGEMKKEVSTEALEKAFSSAGVEGFTAEMLKSKDGIKELREKLNELDDKKLKLLKQNLQEMGFGADQAQDYVDQLRGSLHGVETEADGIKRAASEMDNLKNQVLQFFSITNSIQLFKRAVTSALNTVKELDATMTEAAVVTDFSIDDMWGKLPQYSAQARELGVSINSMYQATTLYYQQGLKNNEAMALGVETMKMGKIAAMDSAEATKAMTAALRGFNMELNETSATRVNDVYSQLAAVTAADTNQIATAMEKTASIAASANMEFETTAALLAQIIETTQEAPETAGTAMKTIIARFAEVKSLRNQGQMSGKDSEGEDIDVNKIQTALRSVGISMDGFFAGTEGLDSVLLKLSEKWQSLDFETQRYIATMAAGSRQQSRFIAMMSDYERTTELVNEAQNSSGASQEQFEKTQDSLATSLTNLKNAWDQFLMGLANNEVLTFAIDLLTKIIEGANLLIDALSGGNGLIKSIITLGTVIAGLKVGKGAVNKVLGFVGSSLGLQPNLTQPDKVVNPHMIKNPTKQGKDAGEQAGTGFISGWKRVLKKNKKEGDSFFKSADIKKEREQALENNFKHNARVNLRKMDDTDIMQALVDRNKTAKTQLSNEQMFEVWKVYDLDGADAAIKKYEDLGGSILTAEEASKLQSKQNKVLGMDFQALGQTIAGVGGVLMIFADVLESCGANEEVVKWIRGFGTAAMLAGSAISLIPGLIKTIETVAVSAGIKVQTAWWWLVAIMAVLAAIVGVVYLLTKNSNSLEKKIESAQKRTKAAEDAAREAKEAYDTLFEQKNKYSQLQTTLGALTKGTNEWKQALFDANAQVLELLEKYPQLQTYLSTGENGELKISDEGWQYVMDQQEKAVQNSTVSVLSAQVEEQNLKEQAAWNNFADEARLKGFIGSDLKAVYLEYLQNPEIFTKNADGSYKQELLDLNQRTQDTGGNAQVLIDLIPELEKYIQLERKNDMAANTAAENAIIAGLSQENRDLGFADEIAGVFAKQMRGYTYNERVEKREKELTDSTNKAQRNKLARQYGVESELTGKVEKDLQVIYAAMMGIGVDEISDDLKDDVDALAKEISKMDIASEFSDAADSFISRLQKLSQDEQKRYSALLSGRGSGLTLKQLNEAGTTDLATIASKLEYDSVTQMGEEMGYKEIAFNDLTYEDKIAYIDRLADKEPDNSYIRKNKDGTINYAETISSSGDQIGQISVETQLEIDTKQAQQQLEETKARATEIFETKGIDVSGFENTTVEIFDKISKQIKGMSSEQAQEYINNWNKIMASEGIDKGAAEAFLSDIDWSNMSDAMSAMQYLQGQGLDSSQIVAFWTQATDAANLYAKTVAEAANLTKTFQSQIVNAHAAADRLINGKGTAEDLALLQQAGIDLTNNIMLTAEGWKIIGMSAEEISQKTIEATAMQAEGALNAHKSTIADYEELVQTGQLGAYITKNEDGTYTTDTTKLNTVEEANMIANELGLGGQKEGESDADYITRIQGEISRVATALENAPNTTEILEQNKAYTAAAMYTTDEQQARYLAGEATEQDVKYSAHNEAQRLGLDGAELEAFAQQLGGTAQAYDQAISNMKMNSGLTEIIDSYDTWGSLIDENDGLIKATTADEVKAFNDLKKATNKMLNTSEDLSEEFWSNAENMKNLEKAAKGDTEALEALQKAASADYLQHMDLGSQVADVEGAQTAINGFVDYMNSIDIPKLEAGVQWNDQGAQDFISRFNDMAAASNMTAEQIQESVKAMGFDAKITYKEDTRKVPVEYTERIVDEWDKETGVATKWHTQTYTGEPTEVTGWFPVVETLTSNGSGGGGISETTQGAANKGGGGGSKHKNSHDKSYNTIEKISSSTRQAEQLERRYNSLLEDRSKTYKDILATQKDSIANLKQQNALQNQLISEKEDEMQSLFSEYSEFAGYVTYDAETKTIQIDWDKFNAITDSETGQRADEFLSKVEGVRDQIVDAQNTIADNQDQMKEILERGKDDYFDMESQIKDAVMRKYQDQIDELSNINDSINDTNGRLLDAMQESIDLARQQRENDKTKESIEDKQQKLAYLQMDTSGANQAEIMSLQQEIEQDQESYTDTLIDQKISELQRQNDKAAEQRERQISLAQEQLNHWETTGGIWAEVDELWKKAIDENGVFKEDSELMKLLKTDGDYHGLSKFGKDDWMDTLSTKMKNALLYKENKENPPDTSTPPPSSGDTGDSGGGTTGGTTQTKNTEDNRIGIAEAIWYKGSETSGWGTGATRSANIDAKLGAGAGAQVQSIINKIASGNHSRKYGNSELSKFYMSAFKTGGLADFTGPAWLDGTKSRPEYVLNPSQTRAFFTLVDVLSGLQAGTLKTTQNSGDNTYDIDINVESIGNDYDVDRLAEKVRLLISEDARYRNNNTVRLMR